MIIAGSSNVRGKPRALVWIGVTGLFALASAIQIAVYGAPSVFHFRAYAAPSAVSQFFALAWLFAPAALAVIASIRVLRGAFNGVSGTGKALAVTLAMFLALISIYVGAFVSFNTWGT